MYTFTTITSLDAASGNQKDAQTYLLGSGNILYVSPDAMYVSYQKYHPVIHPMRGGMGIAPPQPVAVGGGMSTGGSAGVSTAVDAAISSPSGAVSTKIAVIPPDFNTLTDAQRQAILDGLRTAEQDAIRRQETDQTTTVIHKIAIQDGKITYIGKGEVPGALTTSFRWMNTTTISASQPHPVSTPSPGRTATTMSMSLTGRCPRSVR